MAEAGPEGGQVPCFGDSLLQHGLAPRVFETEARPRGYNFALGGKGASALSSDVGQAIRRRLVGLGSDNRWIAIRDYWSRPDAAPLEDLDQSSVVAWSEMRAEKMTNS